MASSVKALLPITERRKDEIQIATILTKLDILNRSYHCSHQLVHDNLPHRNYSFFEGTESLPWIGYLYSTSCCPGNGIVISSNWDDYQNKART